MRLVFAGLENSLELTAGETSVLQVENSALFTRIVASLQSGLGRQAMEPYSLWNDDEEIKPGSALMVVPDALNLPWDDRAFMTAITKKVIPVTFSVPSLPTSKLSVISGAAPVT